MKYDELKLHENTKIAPGIETDTLIHTSPASTQEEALDDFLQELCKLDLSIDRPFDDLNFQKAHILSLIHI